MCSVKCVKMSGLILFMNLLLLHIQPLDFFPCFCREVEFSRTFVPYLTPPTLGPNDCIFFIGILDNLKKIWSNFYKTNFKGVEKYLDT